MPSYAGLKNSKVLGKMNLKSIETLSHGGGGGRDGTGDGTGHTVWRIWGVPSKYFFMGKLGVLSHTYVPSLASD